MTLKECCDEIARRMGWERGEYKRIPGMGDWVNDRTGRSQPNHPVADLDDLVDYWPRGWQTAGHGTQIGDKPTVWGAVATRRNGQGQMITVSGHASMFEAEAFLLLRVLEAEEAMKGAGR